jgi:esterase/lipase superfamily enzyme
MQQTFANRVYINPGALNSLDEATKKVDLIGMIEKPLFRVADTGVSYRTVSSLDSESLLPDHSQTADRGWRSFSIKDYLYLLVMGEFKSFGAKNSQLIGLKEVFYGEQKLQSSEAIACVFGKIEISILLYSDGTVAIVDTYHAAFFEDDNKQNEAFIKVSVNKFINYILEQTPIRERFEALQTGSGKVLDFDLVSLSPKEFEIIDMLRNDDYSAITVLKKDGEPNKITAKNTVRAQSGEGVIAKALIDLIKSKSYGSISITKQDGRIVHVASEDTIKL